jgi:phytoene desaturase
MNIAVIGSGIAGLAVSARLASQGHRVTVYEKNASIGGKISLVEKEGFTWDGGPSFFTDVGEYLRLFQDCGEDPAKYFSYQELDEACRYVYEDLIVRGFDSPVRLAGELERAFGEPTSNTLQFLESASSVYNSVAEQFLNHKASLSNFIRPQALVGLRNVPLPALFRSMHQMHEQYLTSPRTVQFFDRFATYVGADPKRAPGLLLCMPHLEHVVGAYHPNGGMRSLVNSAYALTKKLGVVIRPGSQVDGLYVVNQTLRGVEVNGKHHAYDAVVNAGDVANVYKWLNDGRYRRHIKREHSLSAYVLYLGIKRFTDTQYLHTIMFSDDYDAEGVALWQDKMPYHDPTIYINNTSFLEPSHAPKGHENWFVMVNVPAGLDGTALTKARKYSIDKLSKRFGTDISKHIVCEAEALTPRYIEDQYSAYGGAIYGLAANSIRGAYMRPANKDEQVEGLYHVGVTTHPGGGIPLALRSARIVSGMIG